MKSVKSKIKEINRTSSITFSVALNVQEMRHPVYQKIYLELVFPINNKLNKICSREFL